MSLLSLAIFILVFGSMVMVHEFGHFIAARLCGIEVEEFGFGLPTPGAITLFTWKGTRFTLNWLPFGGFVRPKGENDPTIEGGLAAAKPWKRLVVLFAGPLMNLIVAVVLFSIIFGQVGVPDPTRVLVTDVVSNSPAAQAGFASGDIFVSGNNQPIHTYDDLRAIIDGNQQDKSILFLVERKGKQIELNATPHMDETSKRVMIGVGLGTPFKQSTSMLETLSLGFSSTMYNARALILLPANMIRGTLAPDEGRLIGLKGIYDILQQSVKQDVKASENVSTAPVTDPYDKPIRTLSLIASLSISLGIFNLFPFPALDGGRIIFVIPELLFRRRVPAQFENLVHGLGMTILLLFMIYINVMDFIHPITIPGP